MIQRIIDLLGGTSETYKQARGGAFRNVFCPHCGEFIPSKYVALSDDALVDGDVAFRCPNCEQAGAVTMLPEKPEIETAPLHGPSTLDHDE